VQLDEYHPDLRTAAHYGDINALHAAIEYHQRSIRRLESNEPLDAERAAYLKMHKVALGDAEQRLNELGEDK